MRIATGMFKRTKKVKRFIIIPGEIRIPKYNSEGVEYFASDVKKFSTEDLMKEHDLCSCQCICLSDHITVTEFKARIAKNDLWRVAPMMGKIQNYKFKYTKKEYESKGLKVFVDVVGYLTRRG